MDISGKASGWMPTKSQEPMTSKQTQADKTAHLKVALIFLGAWVLVAFVIFRNIRELGGINGLLGDIQDGNYSELILLALSIFVLAQGLYHLFKDLGLPRRE